MPAGRFRARDGDGRLDDVPYWYIDAELAAQVIQLIDAQANDLVLDYEHATMRAAAKGEPAPAAGWFRQLEWREGKGLYAIDARWTARAAAMIEAGEYRYISPLFLYDGKTGAVKRLVNAALTNSPALDGMDELLAQAAVHWKFDLSQMEETNMKPEEMLAALREALGLNDKADADAVVTASPCGGAA